MFGLGFGLIKKTDPKFPLTVNIHQDAGNTWENSYNTFTLFLIPN